MSIVSKVSPATRALALAVSCFASACVGEVGDAPSDDDAVPFESPPFAAAPGRLRRLSADQYANAIRDVFGAELVVPRGYDQGDPADGLLAVGAGLTSVVTANVTTLETLSLGLSAQIVAPGVVRDRLVTCTPAGEVDDACAAEILGRVARLAYRRPVASDELAELVDLAHLAGQTRHDFDQGLRYAIAAILQSPSFLYRVELGRTTAEDATPGRYDGFELATRIAFFLWNTTPDAALLADAESGALETDEGLAAAVDRMQADPRVRNGVRAFFSDMLQLRRLDILNKDPNVYVHFSTALGASAREETLRGIESLVVDERGDYRDFLTTRTTFVDRRLAAIYDVPAPSLEGFSMLRFPSESPRAGFVGQVTFLALNAHAASSSATLRGKYVREVLLCGEIPPPPPGLNTSIPDATESRPTLRDRVDAHLTVPSCRSCHQLTDPVGLGFENFDGIGRFRRTENGATIDATGVLNGIYFREPRQLGAALREHPELPKCLVRTAYRYATGHVEITGETETLRTLLASFVDDGHDVMSLMRSIVLSRGFRESSEPVIEETP